MEPVDPAEYRQAAGHFVTGVTVATTRLGDVHHGITVNSFTSVSLDPLLALICVEKIARFHTEVLESGVWAVSVLGAAQERASRHFATRGRPETEEQFAAYPHSVGRATGCILLDESLATFECRTVGTVDGGDHTVLVGEVLAVDVPRPDAAPLLYYRGGYRSFTG